MSPFEIGSGRTAIFITGWKGSLGEVAVWGSGHRKGQGKSGAGEEPRWLTVWSPSALLKLQCSGIPEEPLKCRLILQVWGGTELCISKQFSAAAVGNSPRAPGWMAGVRTHLHWADCGSGSHGDS